MYHIVVCEIYILTTSFKTYKKHRERWKQKGGDIWALKRGHIGFKNVSNADLFSEIGRMWH